MALEEVTFTNLVGDEVNLSNLVNQMVDYYNQKLEVGETRVTDFNEGSEIRNLLEAVAVMSYAILEDETEASKLPFIATSYGTYLDRIGENPFINLPRVMGAVAEGNVTFTLASAQSSDVVVQAQTLLEDSVNGLEFVTLTDLTIPAGETTGDVGVECLTEGSDGNVASGTLTVISDSSVDTTLLSVSNSEALYNGSDYEDDEDYRQRLLDNVQADGFGTLGYYTKLAEAVDGVHDVKFVSDASYTRKVLVNGFTKETPDSVLLDVLSVFSDVNNLVLGHSFTVDKPSYTTALALTFTLNVLSEQSTTDLTNLITKVVYGGGWDRAEFEGLDIGEDLTRDRLVDGLSLLDDVQSVSVKVTGQSSEFDTTSVTANQVVKLGTLSFTQNVVG